MGLLKSAMMFKLGRAALDRFSGNRGGANRGGARRPARGGTRRTANTRRSGGGTLGRLAQSVLGGRRR